jgi:hypothetical protein
VSDQDFFPPPSAAALCHALRVVQDTGVPFSPFERKSFSRFSNPAPRDSPQAGLTCRTIRSAREDRTTITLGGL